MKDAQTDSAALDVDAMLARASATTGLSDFGGPEFREGFGRLIAMYNGPAALTERGCRSTYRRLMKLLTNRLRVSAALAANPEVRNRRILRPLYVVSLPRTGNVSAVQRSRGGPCAPTTAVLGRAASGSHRSPRGTGPAHGCVEGVDGDWKGEEPRVFEDSLCRCGHARRMCATPGPLDEWHSVRHGSAYLALPGVV